MTSRPIVSTQNPRVRQLVLLRERRRRDRSDLFVIEGFRELSRALEAGVELVSVYSCPALYLGANEDGLVRAAAASGAEAIELGETAFRRASYRDRPEGLMAVARKFATGFEAIDLTGEPLLLVVESIEKPGNLGTMLRTADAAGVRAVVVCDPTTDPFNPNVIRASLGTLFTVPLAVSETRAAVRRLRKAGVHVVATSPKTSRLHWDADYRGSVAVVIGSEQYGLSDAWTRAADESVRIPMAGRADSLNAAAAAAVVLFEAVRQRS